MTAIEIVARKGFEAFVGALPQAPATCTRWEDLAPQIQKAWIEAISAAIVEASCLPTGRILKSAT